MFDIGLSGLFTGPVGAFENVKDENLKRAGEVIAVSFGFNQYITFFYCLGVSVSKKRIIGFLGYPFIMMAMSAVRMLMSQDQEKVICLAIPSKIIQNNLLNEIYIDERKLK